jgi:hypothetical protein
MDPHLYLDLNMAGALQPYFDLLFKLESIHLNIIHSNMTEEIIKCSSPTREQYFILT